MKAMLLPLGLAVLLTTITAVTPVLAQKEAKPATPAPVTAAAPAKKNQAPSACAGLAQSPCAANKECGWITPKKEVSSNGRKLKAYCRKIAGIAKKK
jgi:negative regulator of sigma E activity